MAIFFHLIVYVFVIIVAWNCACSILRHRRSSLIASLDPRKDAHAIIFHTMYVEFPFLFRKALEFGLLRTSAIPRISGMVHRSGHLAQNPSKRYDETEIFIAELLQQHVDDGDRASLALRRLNFIHSHFPIDNTDYLYVLSVLVLTPIEWATIYGHRAWTELEKCAYYNVWHDIGTRMGIHHIPESIQALSVFKQVYEAKHMIYSCSNEKVANLTMSVVLSIVPSFLWPLARSVLYSMMDDHLLLALGYPKQPRWLRFATRGLLKLHGSIVCWLPPRPLSWAVIRIPKVTTHKNSDSITLYKLSFHLYKPISFDKGYNIEELGPNQLGLGQPYQGKLIITPHCITKGKNL